tara:strand:- start:40 stop:459 length:420 start_codon:yes stop_codon:yes gene_type:complete
MVQTQRQNKMGILDLYGKLKKGNKPRTKVTLSAYVPKPKESDYNRGYIRRFFAQPTNDKLGVVTEISGDDYIRISTSALYRAVTLRWRIKGPLKMTFKDDGTIADKGVSESNRIALDIVSKDMPGIKLYILHLLQFYKK